MHKYPCKIDCPNRERHCIFSCEAYKNVKQEVVSERVALMKKEGRYTEKKISQEDRSLIEKINTGLI